MFLRLRKEDKCWCGSGKTYGECHYETEVKLAQFKKKGCIVPKRRILKTPEQIDGIRESGKVNIEVLDYVAENIHIGMSTEEIDKLVYDKTKELGGIPAPLHYEGFPKSVCTSVNNQVCHGMPSDKVILQDGDIVNVDVSTIYKDYFSDSSRMFCLGNVSPNRQKLVEVAKKTIELGLEMVKPWNKMGDMSQVINDYAKANGYSVVEEVGGHGVGLEFHEEPYVCFVAPKGTEMVMAPGMVFTIEPMINMGRANIFVDDKNGWTIYTEDHKCSAQWEVTVAVTDTGYEVLAY